MSLRNTALPFLASLALLALSGCVDLEEVNCESDDDCRFGRVCSTSGQCTWTAPPVESPNNPDDPRDVGPDTPPIHRPDAGPAPDATTPPDATPQPDTRPQPDVGVEPDTRIPDTSVPDTSTPDTDVRDVGPDVEDADVPDTPECPVALARAKIQGASSWRQRSLTALPLDTIELDATGSTGDITRYEWTIVSRPNGSTQRLMPSNTVAQPKLFLDLAGSYTLELLVTYDDGNFACNSIARMSIRAVPTEDVHIELTWNTPGDPDQTDGSGTDLDLHYLHPQGIWDEHPWDIFWRNPRGDWGVQGDSSDDPSLDLDDTNGAGPENITHSGLEPVTYNIGAFYYASGTLGASYVTLKVYTNGTLAFEHQDKYLPHDGTFWHAAQLTWPSGQAISVNRVYEGFPMAP